MNTKLFKQLSLLLPIILIFFASCEKENSGSFTEPVVTGPNVSFFALSATNDLIKLNANKPDVFTSKTPITGIGAGEQLLSIDFRPATGELYGVSTGNKLYIINTTTAAARVVSNTPFAPGINGTIASMDFNPTVDRIRLVVNTGVNLRLNPENGTVAAIDGQINKTGGFPSVVTGLAYTNSKAGATTTTLYDIDQSSATLDKQNPPNNGTLEPVGNLGFSYNGQTAFDISPDNSNAFLAANTAGSSNGAFLFSVNLTTGATTRLGMLKEPILDLAFPTDPVAYALDATSSSLLIFNPESPAPVSKAITGLQAGETLLGIDFRPTNGQLYGLGSTSRLYALNTSSGAATAVGGVFATPLSGTDFGFDFNPTVDRIRVVSNTGQNLRLNPDNGAVAFVDVPLNGASTSSSAAAYTNNFAGATTTSLFTIDHNTDMLYLSNPPNNGVLTVVGALGVDVAAANGFDIGSTSGKAYLVATVAGAVKIYTVNTATGAATAGVTLPSAVKGFSVGLGF